MANNLTTADRAMALQLLRQAVADNPKGKAGVAARLGYGRPMISRVLSENDKAGLSDKLAHAVIDAYHVVPKCPGTGAEQPRSECIRIAAGKAPMHNPAAMRVWKTCQTCPHKPVAEGAAS